VAKKGKTKEHSAKKMLRTTCHKCHIKGHYGNMCPNLPPAYGMLTLTNTFFYVINSFLLIVGNPPQ
jgi:hypothetical protein